MKWLFIITSFAIIACSGFAGEKKTRGQRKNAFQKPHNSSGSVAVLELFTSEGCSSCPPADRLLPQLADLDANVIPLSFHVDYWNHLGWKDPFSKAEFSDRQRTYGERFHLESIYTPQLIINGEYELVGSSRSTAEPDIKKVLSEKPGVEIKIDEVKRHENELSVSCHLNGDWKNTNLAAAVVQNHAEVQVKGGENGGKKLSHINIVRAFVEKPSESKMNFQLEIPTDLKDDNLQLILYVQQQGDLKVAGATVYLPIGNK